LKYLLWLSGVTPVSCSIYFLFVADITPSSGLLFESCGSICNLTSKVSSYSSRFGRSKIPLSAFKNSEHKSFFSICLTSLFINHIFQMIQYFVQIKVNRIGFNLNALWKVTFFVLFN